MRRCLQFALAVLAMAACGTGSGAPSGGGTPLSLGNNDPAPPTRDNPGSSREPPSGSSGGHGQGSSSGGPAGCPCAGSYSCATPTADGGAVFVSISPSGGSCVWSGGNGQGVLQLGCDGMATYQGYVYTSSWSGSNIQLCLSQQGQTTTCIDCVAAATPGG